MTISAVFWGRCFFFSHKEKTGSRHLVFTLPSVLLKIFNFFGKKKKIAQTPFYLLKGWNKGGDGPSGILFCTGPSSLVPYSHCRRSSGTNQWLCQGVNFCFPTHEMYIVIYILELRKPNGADWLQAERHEEDHKFKAYVGSRLSSRPE